MSCQTLVITGRGKLKTSCLTAHHVEQYAGFCRKKGFGFDGEEKGCFLKKTWKIASDVDEVLSAFRNDRSGSPLQNPYAAYRRRCPHTWAEGFIRPGMKFSSDRKHCKVLGDNTKCTESYTWEMVNTIHFAFERFAERVTSNSGPFIALPALCISQHPSHLQS